MVSADPTLIGYSQDRARAFYQEVRERIIDLPGVLSVSLSNIGLLTGSWGRGITVEGYRNKEDGLGPDRDIAGPGYFTTLFVPILQGRDFGPQDHAHSPHVAYAITRRTREIGIRMALGAQHSTVVRSVMSEVAVLVLTGIGLGLPCALVLGRLIRSLLFEVKTRDAKTLLGATALALVVTLIAGYRPARRANALRHE